MTLLIPYGHYYRVAGPPKEYRFWGFGLTGGFWQSQLNNRMGDQWNNKQPEHEVETGCYYWWYSGTSRISFTNRLYDSYTQRILCISFLGLLCFWGRGL